MNPKSTMLLLLSLTTAVGAASAPTEPNDAAAKLSFEMNDETVPWVIGPSTRPRSSCPGGKYTPVTPPWRG